MPETPSDEQDTMLVIGRKDGSSSTRRQRRFRTRQAGERALTRWAAEGFNVFWTEVGAEGLSEPFRLEADGTRTPFR